MRRAILLLLLLAATSANAAELQVFKIDACNVVTQEVLLDCPAVELMKGSNVEYICTALLPTQFFDDDDAIRVHFRQLRGHVLCAAQFNNDDAVARLAADPSRRLPLLEPGPEYTAGPPGSGRGPDDIKHEDQEALPWPTPARPRHEMQRCR